MAPRRKKKKNTARRAKLGLAFGIVWILGLVCFVYVYSLVSRRIAQRSSSGEAVILGDALMVKPSLNLSLSDLRAEVLRRRYHEVDRSPETPGEFAEYSDGLLIYTRDFLSSSGRRVAPIKVNINFNTHQIKNISIPDQNYFLLEPEVLATLSGSNLRSQSFRPLRDIPLHMQHALLSAEDQRFYSHFGIDVIGLARAIAVNISSGHVVQGGSTLTQQLAKNLFFSSQRSIVRKVLEAMAAIVLEIKLSKQQIIEMYLNEIYFGQNGPLAVHGVAETSRTFFDKDIKQISIGEAALMAGLIRAPNVYSPRKHPKRAIERRNQVLAQMLEQGYIKQDQYELARRTPIKIKGVKSKPQNKAFFVNAIRREIEKTLGSGGNSLKGIRIYTGINPVMQRCAETSLSVGLEQLEKEYPQLLKHKDQLEGALLSIEPASGKILSWTGGRNYQKDQFDHVSQAFRQIGSTVKPFLYLTALDRNLNDYKVATPISIITDEEIEVTTRNNVWIPENYDKSFRGDVTLRQALEESLNIPAVYVSQRVGIPALRRTLETFRVSNKIPSVPSLALGALDTNLLSLANSFSALAYGGVYVPGRIFTSVLDSDGDTLFDNKLVQTRVAGEAPVFVLNNILQGVLTRGTAKRIRNYGYKGNAAGKTGTSDDTRDAWFIGYTSEIVAGIWIGYDDNSKIGLPASVLATPIWASYMNCIQPYTTSSDFPPPRDVDIVKLDRRSLELATRYCPDEDIITEVFVSGTAPNDTCHLHGGRSDRLESDSPSRSRRRRRSLWETLFGN